MGKRKPPKLASTNIEDLFGLSEPEPVQPKPRSSAPLKRESKEPVTRPTPQPAVLPVEEPTGPSGVGIETWLEQSETLRQENERLRAEMSDFTKVVTTLEQERDALQRNLTTTIEELRQEKERLETLIRETQQHFEQEKLTYQTEQQRLEETIRQSTSTIEQLNSTLQQERIVKEASQETQTLQTLLANRGLRTHTDFTAFLKSMSESTHCWNLFKDALLNKEMAIPFLEQQVHLVSDTISDTSNIAGICVAVSSEKCEIGAGVDLSTEMREVMTEMLLRGWNKLLILGMRRSFVTFFRNAMGESTIEVQVDAREDAWIYSDEMNGYPVIFVMGGGVERIPNNCPAIVLSSNHPVVGPALAELRQALVQIDEDE
jgi:hypothetical protein